jgi:hypothetical protein
MIDELANQYDYAFDTGAFGGAKKIHRKRTTKKSKKKARQEKLANVKLLFHK